jgi:hypothetical protein
VKLEGCVATVERERRQGIRRRGSISGSLLCMARQDSKIAGKEVQDLPQSIPFPKAVEKNHALFDSNLRAELEYSDEDTNIFNRTVVKIWLYRGGSSCNFELFRAWSREIGYIRGQGESSPLRSL